jgi:hypothetical protein
VREGERPLGGAGALQINEEDKIELPAAAPEVQLEKAASILWWR